MTLQNVQFSPFINRGNKTGHGWWITWPSGSQWHRSRRPASLDRCQDHEWKRHVSCPAAKSWHRKRPRVSRDGNPGGSWTVSFWSQKKKWRNTSDTKICIKYLHIAMKMLDWIFWEYWGVNGLPAYRGAFDVLPQIPRCLMVAERVLAHGMSQILWHGCYTEQQTVDIGTFSPLLVAPGFHPCGGHPEIMDISELFIHTASTKSWLFVTSMMFHHDSLSRETSGPRGNTTTIGSSARSWACCDRNGFSSPNHLTQNACDTRPVGLFHLIQLWGWGHYLVRDYLGWGCEDGKIRNDKKN